MTFQNKEPSSSHKARKMMSHPAVTLSLVPEQTAGNHHMHHDDSDGDRTGTSTSWSLEQAVDPCWPRPVPTKYPNKVEQENSSSDHHMYQEQARDSYHHHSDYEGTLDDDDHMFLYRHYDRMCESATANHEHDFDDETNRMQNSDCCVVKNVPILQSSSPGSQHYGPALQLPEPAAMVKKEQADDALLRLLPSLCDGRISPLPFVQQGHVDSGPADNSDSEDSFDDEIHRLFGGTMNEQPAGRLTMTNIVQSLKPRTTTRPEDCASITTLDSSLPSVVTPEMWTLTTTTTNRDFKLVSPSPPPVFASRHESSFSSERSCVALVPLVFTTTSTTTRSSSLQEKLQSGELPALGRTASTCSTMSLNTTSTILPNSVPMTPSPAACTKNTTTAGATTITSPRPLPPLLIGTNPSTSSLDANVPAIKKMHLVSPLLPTTSSSLASSPSNTISAFVSNGRAGGNPSGQHQAQKRLFLFDDGEWKRGALCRREKKPRHPSSSSSSLHDGNDHFGQQEQHYCGDHDGHHHSFLLPAMMATIGQTTTSNHVEPPLQSPPTMTCSSSTSDCCPVTPGGATATTLVPKNDDDHRPVHVVGSNHNEGKTTTGASSSSNTIATTEKKRLLHFWEFQSRSWTAKFREAQAFRVKNGHCRIPENYPENIALGRWAKRQRSQYKILQRTSSSCLYWGGNKNNATRNQHDEDRGTDNSNPTSISPPTEDKNDRQQHQGSAGRILFSSNIVDDKGTKKHDIRGESCQGKIEEKDDEDQSPRLFPLKSSWLRPTTGTATTIITRTGVEMIEDISRDGQRHLGRPTRSSSCNLSLTEERIRLLDSIGFVWDFQASDWFHRYDLLLKFKQLHGHADVPPTYPPNQPLSTWVRTQRRSYMKGSMSADRIVLLDRIGFDWKNPSAKKKTKKKK